MTSPFSNTSAPSLSYCCALAILLVPLSCSSQSTTTPVETGPIYSDVSSTNLPVADLGGLSMDAAIFDADGDGDLDILVANEHRPNILLINDGTGVFSNGSSAIPSNSRDSEDIGLADFDGDGDQDIVIVSEDDRTNELYINNGDGTFTDESDLIPVDGISNSVAIIDANTDGQPDILIGNNGQNRLVINIGDATFIDESALRLPLSNDVTQDLDLGDVDMDGDLDIIVGNEGENKLLINDGDGTFTDESDGRIPLRASQEVTREVDFGDLDGDGDLDVVFGNVTNLVSGGDAQNRVLFNDGTGHFTDMTASHYPVSVERSFEVDVLDIDGDGDNDIVTGNLPGSGGNPVPFSVFQNDGNGLFTDVTSDIFPGTVRGFGFDVVAGDLNGDGNNDLFLANRGSADILLFSVFPR